MRERIPRADGRYAWGKVGYQPAVATTDRAVWSEAGPYVFPASAGKLSIVSSSVNDASAGTGARTVKIYYLTNTFAEKDMTLTMNGTTRVVSTPADFYRLNHAKILTVGSGLVSAGKISIQNEGGTVTYGAILAGETEARQIVYTVPANKTLIIDQIVTSNVATTALKYATIKLMSTYCPVCDIQQVPRICAYEISLDQAVLDAHIDHGFRFPAGTDITMDVVGIAAGIATVSIYGHED